MQALSSTLLYMGSGMALLMTSLLSFAVVALYGVMFATVLVALIGGFMLGLLAFSLFITSGAAFFGATGAALGYATLAAAKASLRMLPGARPDPSSVPGLPESPRLRPVATPRAPVSPAIAASSSGSAPVAALAPAAALPPDPAPASPCRRHATPTSEAFQRSSEGPAALALPPSESPGVKANGPAAGAALPRTEAGEPAKAKAHAAPAHGAAGEAAAHASHVPNGEAHAKAGHQKPGAKAAADHNGMTAIAHKGHASPNAAKREAAKAAVGAQASITDKENLHSVNTADGKAQSVIGAAVCNHFLPAAPCTARRRTLAVVGVASWLRRSQGSSVVYVFPLFSRRAYAAADVVLTVCLSRRWAHGSAVRLVALCDVHPAAWDVLVPLKHV